MSPMIARALRTPLPLLGLLLLGAGCSSDPSGPDTPDLSGGILATFQSQAHGDTFRVWVTDTTAIRQVIDVHEGRSQATIPAAPLRRGAGTADHNAPWSWHMDGSQLVMAEATIEVCDGRPAFVEEELDYWIDTVGSYCPWGVDLVRVEDYR